MIQALVLFSFAIPMLIQFGIYKLTKKCIFMVIMPIICGIITIPLLIKYGNVSILDSRAGYAIIAMIFGAPATIGSLTGGIIMYSESKNNGNNSMPKQAIIYGAGNIGRGFIGQLLYESGYETAFIDVNKELINLINEKKEYPIKFTDIGSEIIVKNVRGIDGSSANSDEISDLIAKVNIMATSVGVNVLKFIMKPIADGINKRFTDNNLTPLNIILCENLIGSDKIMRDGVFEHIDNKFKDLYNDKIGFIEASVARMVPVQIDEMKRNNPLRIATESYKYLHVDKAAFKGDIPYIQNMVAYSPFKYFIERKLYIFNMGHALCAYLGDIAGYEYIWQSVGDRHIKKIITETMKYSALALAEIYNADIDDLNDYIDDLIRRFANKALGDTVKRVGGDLKRKLSPNDRIIGAYKICYENNISVNYICLAIAAAVNFKGDNLSGQSLEEILKKAGSFDLIAGNLENFAFIAKLDRLIKEDFNINDLYNIVKIYERE